MSPILQKGKDMERKQRKREEACKSQSEVGDPKGNKKDKEAIAESNVAKE